MINKTQCGRAFGFVTRRNENNETKTIATKKKKNLSPFSTTLLPRAPRIILYRNNDRVVVPRASYRLVRYAVIVILMSFCAENTTAERKISGITFEKRKTEGFNERKIRERNKKRCVKLTLGKKYVCIYTRARVCVKRKRKILK